MQGTKGATYDDQETGLSQEESFPDKSGSSLDKQKSSPDKAESPLDKEVPPEIREELKELGQRTNPQQFRRVLKRLCDWQSLRAGEIAELTGRDVKYLVQQYLTPMIEDDELEYTIPEMPNHPKQAYRTPDDSLYS
jgi:ATP-dependent DNA helicase RecG